MTDLLLLLITGATAGWAAGRIMRGRGFGFVINVLLGIAGGVVGGAIARALGVPLDGWLADIAVAIGGAALLLVLAASGRRLALGSGRPRES